VNALHQCLELSLIYTSFLGPLAMALGCVIKRADALVVTVPTFVFITMLPGTVIKGTDCDFNGGR
jgi:hypothetical protein